MINATTHPWVRFGATSLDFALINLCLAAAIGVPMFWLRSLTGGGA